MKQKVVISGSGSLQGKVSYWRKYFESKDYEVIAFPKPWSNTSSHDSRLEDLYVSFYEAIDACDVFFLMNEDKGNVSGHIGANCTAELIYATVLKLRSRKDMKIYIAKIPDKNVPLSEEINSFLRLGWVELYKQ